MIRISAIRVVFVLVSALALSFTTIAAAQFETRGRFVAGPSPTWIAVGDFNHDGKPDLVVTAPQGVTGSVVILLGNGDGTFQEGKSYRAGIGPFSVAIADFNGGGNLDLAIANELSPYLTILLGNGDGTFHYGPQSPKTPSFEQTVMVGDFNGDRIPDILALSTSNPCMCISVLLGNGDGTFQEAITTEPTFAMQAVGMGDFNGDGQLDLATAGTFGFGSGVNILLGNGDGTFTLGANYPGDTAPAAIAVADFNGDHNLDLAIANSEGVGISVMLGNGNGTFQPAVDYPIPFSVWVTAADVNGDHELDLIVANDVISGRHNSSGATVFLGNGDGTFQQPGKFYQAEQETSYVAVGDFNSDRKPDLVITDFRFDDVVVMLNTGVVSFAPTTMLNFQKQAVGTTSGPQTVTLTNTGTTALKIASMKASAEFAVTSTCGANVAAGAKCTISVTFSPTQKGARQGTITIIDSASSKPQVIDLFGTGT